MKTAFVPLVLAAAFVSGCGEGSGEAPPPAAAASTPAPLQGSVQRAEVTPPAPAPPPPAAPVALQTQIGPMGTQVDLVRAAVTGDVLTVQLSYKPMNNDYKTVRFQLDEVSVIDDATSQRYGVLRDAANKWQASPLASNDDDIAVTVNNGLPAVAWFKFPAPPAGSPTVSIAIPDVGPFDGVPVRR